MTNTSLSSLGYIYFLRIYITLILHKRQERKERKQRKTEMAATTEHTEEHTAQVHYEENTQLLASLPI